jgi:hypothetical protein
MTQDMEERLISMAGKFDRFIEEWDDRKSSLARCTDVETVDKRLTLHIDEGKHRGASAGMWVASVSAGLAAIAGFAALFGVKI